MGVQVLWLCEPKLFLGEKGLEGSTRGSSVHRVGGLQDGRTALASFFVRNAI